MDGATILTLNSGSSSLKFGLFAARPADVEPLCSGAIEEIGSAQARVWTRVTSGNIFKEHNQSVAGPQEALRIAAQTLDALRFPSPDAVGHRLVHGGPRVRDHQKITPDVMKELQAAVPLAPLHIPATLGMIRQTQERFPGVPQFACLDTAFHRTLPEAACRFALPERFWQAGIRRYGFHGLSCESVLHALAGDIPPRLIVAHLGSGASITAIARGLSIDTTMGLTPTGGIVMGTRPGDLDPGVLLYILRTGEYNVEELEKMLDRESGLLGISGRSSDMRQLHQAQDDPRAQCAIDIFCRAAKKAIGAFIAVLGGVDMLVFTGGIGEHDASVRKQICTGLEPLGIALDTQDNQRNAQTISASHSPARVCVFPSDEDAQIARHTYRLWAKGAASPT